MQRIFTNNNFRICYQAYFSPRGEKRDRNPSTGAGKAAALFFCRFLGKGGCVLETVQEKVSRRHKWRSLPISIVLIVKFHSVKMLVFHFFTRVKLQSILVLVVAPPTILNTDRAQVSTVAT